MRVRYWLGYKARWVYTCQHFCVWSSLLCSTIITKYSNHRSSQSDRFVSFVLGPSPFYTHRVLVAPDIDKLANTYSFFGANLFVHGLFCLPMVYIRGHVIRLSPTKLLVFTLFIWGGGGGESGRRQWHKESIMHVGYITGHVAILKGTNSSTKENLGAFDLSYSCRFIHGEGRVYSVRDITPSTAPPVYHNPAKQNDLA